MKVILWVLALLPLTAHSSTCESLFVSTPSGENRAGNDVPSFTVARPPGFLFEIRARHHDGLMMGTFKVYMDPITGGTWAVPFVAECFRGNGLAFRLYLEGAKVLLAKYGVTLASNRHPGQLTPNARRVWEKMVQTGYAVRSGEGYQMIRARIQTTELIIQSED